MAIRIQAKPNTIAPGGDYPYGDIRDRVGSTPGTPVNREVYADFHQFFARLLDSCGVTANDLADNSLNGFQLFDSIQYFVNRYLAPIVILQIGPSYDPTRVYVLSGATTSTTDGIAFYNGEIYYLEGNTSGSCTLPAVDIVVANSNIVLENNMHTLRVRCGTSGTGICDYHSVIFLTPSWNNVPTLSVTVLGSGTATIASLGFHKYKIVGKTIWIQIRASSVTISGIVNGLQIGLPYLPSNFATAGMDFCGSWNGVSGNLNTNLGTNTLVLSPNTGIPGEAFSTGSSQSFTVNIVAELV